MTNIRPKQGPETGESTPRIEVYVKPEWTRRQLSVSLARTRKRAARLLSQLLKTAQGPAPDLGRIRELAAGIEFEAGLAREIAATLAERDVDSGSRLSQ